MDNKEITKSDLINFASEKSPLQKVGAFIKEGRQARNISIEELSASLRISQEQLTALEEGDEKSLPEKVFVKAMVRRIAEKLKLETDFILEELQGRKTIVENIYHSQSKVDTVPNGKTQNITSLIIIPGLLGISASFLLFF